MRSRFSPFVADLPNPGAFFFLTVGTAMLNGVRLFYVCPFGPRLFGPFLLSGEARRALLASPLLWGTRDGSPWDLY